MSKPECLSPFSSPGTADEDHAGVHVPPPVLHIAAVLSGVGLATVFPLRLPAPTWLAVAGLLLMTGALLIAGWAFREFGDKRNPVPPNQPIGALMTGGPFRFTRNPLYLALALLHAGIGLLSGNAWVLLALIPTLLIVRYYVIAREEAYLIRRFGKAYRDYMASVRRWF